MITIIDYGAGNLRSVAKAFDFLGAEARISGKEEDVRNADKLVLPGVGAFADGMENLRKSGLIEPMREEVLGKKKPILGICLGMQLFARDSDEGGMHGGLGWIDACVRRLEVDPLFAGEQKGGGTGLKVPHMGWNDVFPRKGAALFRGVSANPSFYFVHSYAVRCNDGSIVAATCEYGEKFAAAVQSGSIYGAQFHPEKSQKDGLKVLENFIEL